MKKLPNLAYDGVSVGEGVILQAQVARNPTLAHSAGSRQKQLPGVGSCFDRW